MSSLYLTVTGQILIDFNNFCTVATENECENIVYIYLLIISSFLLTILSKRHCLLSAFTN